MALSGQDLGQLSGKSKGMRMQREFWPDTGQVPRDTTTCEPSETITCNRSISSVVDFRVRISVLQERVRALTADALDSGVSSLELLARYDPLTLSWKTSQRCLAGDLETFSETWPRSGTMRNGTAYLRLPCAPLTEETGFSSWGTPRASIGGGDPEKRAARGMLEGQVLVWPTPRCHNASETASQSEMNRRSPGLGALDTTGARPQRTKRGHQVNLPNALSIKTSRSLNPIWVEQLMGFPDGWTEVGQADQASNKKHGKRHGLPKARATAEQESRRLVTRSSHRLDTSSGK